MSTSEHARRGEMNGELSAYDSLTQQLLTKRGIVTAKDAERFLNPSYDDHLHDPFLLTDMEKAVSRVLRAIADGERIVIYSDYDCDGIPGGVLLHDFFTAIGYTNFENYIPHRHTEGYGFNEASVASFVEKGTKLIVTVDCGITDVAAVAYARNEGIDVIVTDHHEPGETLPSAYAIVNPKRDTAYPFQGICGTAVAYKLVQALLIRGKESGAVTLREGQEKWWLDLVGLATIADMVPLIDEGRVFARYGLQVLRKSRRPGIQHLIRKAGSDQRYLTEDDIGFTIAPRINAASRMDDPEDAFHMLRTKDEGEAGAHVLHLEKLNNERKGVVASMVKEAKKRIMQHESAPPIIVMGNPEWRPSLVGLVANSLAEEFDRPAFLWGRDGNGIIKGSCRSDGTVSVVRIMEHARDALLTFGGHHASGGFSVAHENVHTLAEVLTGAYEKIKDTSLVPKNASCVDATLSLSDIDERLMRTLDQFAPFGEGNQKPVFEFRDVVPFEVTVFGKAHNHTKLRFMTERGTRDAIAFFRLPDSFVVVPEKGKPLTVLAHVERSYFMGRSEIRLRIVDIL